MAVRDILFDVAPEFYAADAVLVARIDRFIGYAAAQIDPNVWGAQANMATALLAAHRLTLSPRGGNVVGPKIGEKVGDISVTYASPVNANEGLDPLDATAYGVQFKQLRAATVVGFLIL